MNPATQDGGRDIQTRIASAARSLWEGPLPETTHKGQSEMVPLWWTDLKVQADPGDIITLVPTPIGTFVECVRKPASKPASRVLSIGGVSTADFGAGTT